MLTRGDKVLILFMVLISIFIFFVFNYRFLSYNDKRVIIQVNGEEYKEFQIYRDMEKIDLEVESEFGYNRIEIDQDGAQVIEASCPDKLDVHQGKIEKVGEIIVCLPNRLTVEIVGRKENKDIDILSK